MTSNDLRKSMVSPDFLFANSTSHVWIFGAIAELIDNTIDARSSSSTGELILQIDKSKIGGKDCLVFTDNGSGMSTDGLHKMLSFGYTHSGPSSTNKIGRYGNGFKSGSMRIGDDVIVLTRDRDTCSVGLLSKSCQTNTGADELAVPILTFNKCDMQMVNRPDSKSLKAITENSVFKSLEEIRSEFEDFESNTDSDTGTRIIIYNLHKSGNGVHELDFETEPVDVLISEHFESDVPTNKAVRDTQGKSTDTESFPTYFKSLREYCSILYSANCFKPGLKIILRGRRVVVKDISRRLRRPEEKSYTNKQTGIRVVIKFGFSPKEEDYYGLMMYHNSRLIKCKKIGCQTRARGEGVGVVGVVEVGGLLKPVQNKQDFVRNEIYDVALRAFGQKLNEYCEEKKEKKPFVQDSASPVKSSVQGTSKCKTTNNAQRQISELWCAQTNVETNVEIARENTETFDTRCASQETQAQDSELLILSDDELETVVKTIEDMKARPSGLNIKTYNESSQIRNANESMLENTCKSVQVSPSANNVESELNMDGRDQNVSNVEITNTKNIETRQVEGPYFQSLAVCVAANTAATGAASKRNQTRVMQETDLDVEEDDEPSHSPSILQLSALPPNALRTGALPLNTIPPNTLPSKELPLNSLSSNALPPNALPFNIAANSECGVSTVENYQSNSLKKTQQDKSSLISESTRTLRSRDKLAITQTSATTELQHNVIDGTRCRSYRTTMLRDKTVEENNVDMNTHTAYDYVEMADETSPQCRSGEAIHETADQPPTVEKIKCAIGNENLTVSQKKKMRKPKLIVLPNMRQTPTKNKCLPSRANNKGVTGSNDAVNSDTGKITEAANLEDSNTTEIIVNTSIDELPDLDNVVNIKSNSHHSDEKGSNFKQKNTAQTHTALFEKPWMLGSNQQTNPDVKQESESACKISKISKSDNAVSNKKKGWIENDNGIIELISDSDVEPDEENLEQEQSQTRRSQRQLFTSAESTANKGNTTGMKRTELIEETSDIQDLPQSSSSELRGKKQSKRQKMSDDVLAKDRNVEPGDELAIVECKSSRVDEVSDTMDPVVGEEHQTETQSIDSLPGPRKQLGSSRPDPIVASRSAETSQSNAHSKAVQMDSFDLGFDMWPTTCDNELSEVIETIVENLDGNDDNLATAGDNEVNSISTLRNSAAIERNVECTSKLVLLKATSSPQENMSQLLPTENISTTGDSATSQCDVNRIPIIVANNCNIEPPPCDDSARLSSSAPIQCPAPCGDNAGPSSSASNQCPVAIQAGRCDDCDSTRSQIVTLTEKLRNFRRNIVKLFRLGRTTWLENTKIDDNNLEKIEHVVCDLIEVFERQQESSILPINTDQ